ncbi:hypothetical protein J2T09_003141 [Neorhizobium huautlense]|uniref:Methyltransferase n=1 Tax=Neorhizobium huautlense TaxID=67774 RepID=A0ABT9PX97_9HYPH|nr:class I SAM-dependent methyltransferase [Neorhizobium huautlense]MDP9838374.1 hypothetical protein [Neorhizobium huautlense]
MLNEIASAVAAKILNEADIAQIQGTQSLRPLDLRKFAQIATAFECGQFYNRHLYNRPYFNSYLDHLAYAAKQAHGMGDGLFLEFGVASGRTINLVARETGRKIIGFDSFKGLPENWRDGVGQGAFATAIPAVEHNVELCIGMIEDELPKLLHREKQKIRFIHIDTDLYGVAKYILETCRDRIDDAVIVFDEFFNYPGYQDHEFKAWHEFQSYNADLFKFSYLGTGGDVAVSARITRQ